MLSSSSLVFKNAEHVLHNFVLAAHEEHVYELSRLLERNWDQGRKDYLVVLVQTMLRREGILSSGRLGLLVLQRLLRVEAENNHEMGVFHFCEELDVEQDV